MATEVLKTLAKPSQKGVDEKTVFVKVFDRLPPRCVVSAPLIHRSCPNRARTGNAVTRASRRVGRFLEGFLFKRPSIESGERKGD
jgi:hypothetical protein